MRTGQNGDAEGLIIGLVSPKTKASTDPVPARPVQSRRGSRPNARRPGHSTARAFMSTPRPSATLDRPHTPSTGPLSLPVFFWSAPRRSLRQNPSRARVARGLLREQQPPLIYGGYPPVSLGLPPPAPARLTCSHQLPVLPITGAVACVVGGVDCA